MRNHNHHRRTRCAAQAVRVMLGATVLASPACGPTLHAGSGQGGHHSSNEDLKRVGQQVSELDRFLDELAGRYRSNRGELIFCRVIVNEHARALVLERSEGHTLVERRLWLIEPSEAMDNIQEFELRPRPPSSVCADLPLELGADAVGKPLRLWDISLGGHRSDPETQRAFVRTTIEGKTIHYERSTVGMLRIEDNDTSEYRTLHRNTDGSWYLPDQQRAAKTCPPNQVKRLVEEARHYIVAGQLIEARERIEYGMEWSPEFGWLFSLYRLAWLGVQAGTLTPEQANLIHLESFPGCSTSIPYLGPQVHP